jgi:branched-chain amino acid aminotransferase
LLEGWEVVVTIVSVDGVLLAEDAARISPFDHALLTGDGVFETLKVYDGVAFAVTRHLARLERSCAGLRLSAPSPATLRATIAAVIAANDLRDARVRITVTGGPAPLGSDRGDAKPTVIVAGSEMQPWPPSADVVVVPWPRNELGALAGLKTVSYAENVVALAHATDRGASEALFGNLAGNLCEGTGSNVFVVLDGRLVTPPLASGCLAGVTRELLLELGHGAELDVPLHRAGEITEAFLTSTTREVQPVGNLDGRALVTTAITTSARDAFRALVASTVDP